MNHSIKNIGILAHVDAGKTSLTEHFLLLGEASLEALATIDENLMEKYFNGESILDEELLNGLIMMMPEAKRKDDAEFHAKVFKVEHDKILGRIAYLRNFQRQLCVRDTVFNQRLQKEEKAAQIFRFSGKKAQGLVKYTMPKPCWAVMLFEIEPLPPGSGFRYESMVRTM